MKVFVIAVFIITYVLLFSLQKYRHLIALSAAAVFVISGALPLDKAFSEINWNVLLMLTGTMGTVALFIDSGMPAYIADSLLVKSSNIMVVTIMLSVFAGVVSAFVDNVATVLMIAPVALAIAKKIKMNPAPLLICIAVSSNLQGAATLVGDTTSILLGGYAGMSFNDFIFMDGKPSIFWAVELGAAATIPVIMFLFRKNRDKISAVPEAKVNDIFPSILLFGTIAVLIAASFIPDKPEITNGLICMAIFLTGLIYTIFVRKNKKLPIEALKSIDLETLLLLTALFVIIGTLSYQGIISRISEVFIKLGGNSRFVMYSFIVWGSVFFSAFVDNIPYVATMLPVIQKIGETMGYDPTLLYFGLLTGATLGGNLTPVGASANITAIGILRKNGYEVKNSDFFKIGIPFTLTAVTVGYLFCWIVWN